MINRRRQPLCATVDVDVFKERLVAGFGVKTIQQAGYWVDRQISASFRDETNTEYIYK